MKKSDLKSFSAVATHEVKKEAAVMAFSVRRFYQCPICFICDSETKEYLEALPLDNLEFQTIAEESTLEVLRDAYSGVSIKNTFHRVDCIALKMDCLNWAVRLAGNTMFLDTDIILTKPIHQDIKGEMMLSPHYNFIDRLINYRRYGIYNAGYLWTNEPTAGDAWREIYLNRSDFFEQQGMIYLHEHFDIKRFDETHNVGFWRMPLVNSPTGKPPRLDGSTVRWEEVKSIHAHVFPECYTGADSGLMKVYNQNREFAMQNCGDETLEFIESL